MLFIHLNKAEKRSYTRQICKDIREKILNGDLKEGFMLPSTRELSAELSISRNTVLTAYDMLVSEGFLRSIPGSGLYVNRGIRPSLHPLAVSNDQAAVLSDDRISCDMISFDSGIPALELFPLNKWNSYVSRAFREASPAALGYDDPQGRPELRSILADYLKKTRGIDCSPDQILITSGAKQGLTLAGKCLLENSSVVLIEDPSNRNVKQIFSYHTKQLIPVPVDQQGIITERLPHEITPNLIFTTPSRQFPMGGQLTIQRRLELIDYARKVGCFIIEDDYDSDFRYDGALVNSLYTLDPLSVIYVGTFSKILYPSLRLGYMILPMRLVPRFREWKRLSDHHSDSVSQLALMRFIENGELDRHIRHMKKIYRGRRDLLLELLERYFPGKYRTIGESAGMHLVLELPGVCFTQALARRIRAAGIYAIPVEEHAIVKGFHQNQLILGYAHLAPEDMVYGLQKLKEAIEK